MTKRRLTTVEIDHLKIVGYLLNKDHPKGGSKARFFLACGYSIGDPQGFADALFQHLSSATTMVLGKTHPLGYGTTQVASGPMPMPDGTTRRVTSVWLAHPDGERVTLVTAYPDV